MNLREAPKQVKQVVAELPHLRDDGEEFRMLWSCGNYDGPTSGVCLVRGSAHWFERIAEGPAPSREDGTPQFTRIFAIAALTPQEFDAEDCRHRQWEACFGERRYVYPDGRRTRADTPAQCTDAQRESFYKSWMPLDRQYADKDVIGWWGFRAFDFDALLSSELGLNDDDEDEEAEDAQG